MSHTQGEIEAALDIVKASGQFSVTRIRPPIGTCRTCWGHKIVGSGVGNGSYIDCPKCVNKERT